MSEFIKVKTDELTGSALDWAVALAIGETLTSESVQDGYILVGAGVDGDLQREFYPSTDWAQGGPLLEKYSYALPYLASSRHHIGKFESCTPGGFPHNGRTPLIAACRSIVAAKFGDVVQVPVELLGGVQ